MNKFKKWTDDERRFIKENWSSKTMGEIGVALQRTVRAIRKEANLIGLSNPFRKNGLANAPLFYDVRPWMQQDLATLESMYLSGKKLAEISAALNRSIPNIKRQRSKMPNLKRDREQIQQFWSENDDAFIRERWGDATPTEIAIALGKETRRINQRAAKLGLDTHQHVAVQLWSDQELQFLRDNYPQKSRSQLAKELNRSKVSVNNKIAKFRKVSGSSTAIAQPKRVKQIDGYSWSNADNAYLQANFRLKSNYELSATLGRTIRSVAVQLTYLGLKRDRRLLHNSVNEISDGYATSLFTRDPEIRKAILQQPALLKVRKAKLVLDRRIKLIKS